MAEWISASDGGGGGGFVENGFWRGEESRRRGRNVRWTIKRLDMLNEGRGYMNWRELPFYGDRKLRKDSKVLPRLGAIWRIS